MQTEQIYHPKYQDRINRLKEKINSSPHGLCIERGKLFTESYKKTRSEHPYIRFAKAMEHFLSNMSLIVWDDEFIVGNRCTKYVGTPIYPEVRVDTLEQDVDTFENRPAQKMFISSEERDFLKNTIIPYWKHEEDTVKTLFLKKLDPQVKEVMDSLLFTVEAEMTNGVGHFFPGHENLLKLGFKDIIKKAEDSLKELPLNSDKGIFLKAVIIVCEAVRNTILRLSEHVKKLADETLSNNRKKELLEISSILESISSSPPKSFKEALQLIYLNHLFCGLEDGGYAISVGRLDQLLYPFYIDDINNSIITKEETQFLIECFFLKLSTLWNYVFYLGVNAAEGPPIAENVTIGGLDRGGNDVSNELSHIILDAYTNLKTVQPTFSVRIHNNTSNDFIKDVGKSIKAGASIALFNDDVMIDGLVKRGFTLEDAREYAPIGCVEPQHPCKSFGSTNANQFNIAKCLELALNNGTDTFLRREIGVKQEGSIKSYDELWTRFLAQMNWFIEKMVATMSILDETIAEIKPQPFLSATIDNCIQRGLDVTQGGAIYNFTGPQLIGLATVADSLAVIKHVVFEEGLLNLDELKKMLMKNFRGNYKDKTGNEWREYFINKVPKFGNDIDYVDTIAMDIAKAYCDEIAKYSNFRDGKFNPGIYSTSLHLTFGAFTGASADGRKSRDPLSNGLGPTHGRDKNGPTAILNSVKKLRNELMTNGNSLLLAFHPNTINEEIFLPLIRTFFTIDGGYQIQFNVIGKDTLQDAQKQPDLYKGLVVRIAGYSVLFTELSKNAQDEIIARTLY